MEDQEKCTEAYLTLQPKTEQFLFFKGNHLKLILFHPLSTLRRTHPIVSLRGLQRVKPAL